MVPSLPYLFVKYVVSPNRSLKFKFFMDLTKVETLINLDQPILDIFGREKKSLALLALDCRLSFWINFLALNLS